MVEFVFGSSLMLYGRSATIEVADYSRINKLASRYKSVNLSAPKRPGPKNW
jgi:hypothetical protein